MQTTGHVTKVPIETLNLDPPVIKLIVRLRGGLGVVKARFAGRRATPGGHPQGAAP